MTHNSRSWWRRCLDSFYAASVSSRRRRARLLLEALEERWMLSPVNYVVTSTADSGAGTLRDAINQLNAHNPSFTDEIDFKLGSSGVQTINLLSPLPVITAGGVFINGITEPGSSPGAPFVQLNGASAGSAGKALEFSGANGIVVGLIIDNFGNDGILLDSGANSTQIYACFLGVNPSGNAALGNGGNGLDIFSNNNTIGLAGNFSNVISGNSGNGISFEVGATSSASGNEVLGNFIGTNAAGTAALGNFGNGIVDDGVSNTIGLGGSGNVISGNLGDGIAMGRTFSDLIQGNFIGTNAAGTSALGNGGNGVEGAFVGNTIGGSSAGSGNIIAGNSGTGIILGDNGLDNLVQGNNVGVNVNGGALGNSSDGIFVFGTSTSNTLGGTTAAAANNISDNSQDGIRLGGNSNAVLGNNVENNALNGIEIGGTNNTIGGTTTAARNIISLNGQDGVLIDSSGSSNGVEGNDIGTSSNGNTAQGNGANGVEIAGSDNTIGSGFSDSAGARNVISANAQDGILIDSGANFNDVINSFIGTNNAGTTALSNSVNGVEILSSNNDIVGEAGFRTLISGNGSDGVVLGSSASGNLVAGCFIGTNAAGTGSLANSANGIEVLGVSNSIGFANTLLRNVISGNAEDGVLLGSGASGNTVLNSYIGTNAAGTAALGNGLNGVEILNSNNTLGGTTAAARNVLSGNAQDGVLIDNGVSGTVVEGNFVGTNVNGTASVGNVANGIEVFGVNNTIGGSTTGQRNVVSGNFFDGILLDSGATGNRVQGNYVGTNSAGTAALANSTNGIEVDGVNNTIGGVTAAARNVLSGNFNDGVLIAAGASGVAVQGNYIGTTNTGNAPLANGTGVEVQANGATIGGVSAARNVISGNSGDGVDIDSGTSGAVVQGNYIGTNVTASVAVSNGGFGVNIAGSNTQVGGPSAVEGNLIANNTAGGVNIHAGSGNTVRSNSITANGPSHVGPGITLATGANNNIVAPTLSTATLNGTTLTVTGTFTAAAANVPYVLEFFVSPAGDPEGKTYVGKLTVIPGGTGTQSFTFKASTSAASSTTLITATLTDSQGDTSAFSNGVTS